MHTLLRLVLSVLFGIVKYTFICLVLIYQIGCHDNWYFQITDIHDLSHPRFCISHYTDCRGRGISPFIFVIQEVDLKGSIIKDMWIIEFEKDVILKEIIYGIPPDGYKEKIKAIPLQADRFYSIQGGAYYFRLMHVDGKIVPEVWSYNDFHERSQKGLLK